MSSQFSHLAVWLFCCLCLLSKVAGSRATGIWEVSSGWGQPESDFSLLSSCSSPSRNTEHISPLMGLTCHYNRLYSRSVSVTQPAPQPRDGTLFALAPTGYLCTDIKDLCQDSATHLQTGKSLGVTTNSRLLHQDQFLLYWNRDQYLYLLFSTV